MILDKSISLITKISGVMALSSEVDRSGWSHIWSALYVKLLAKILYFKISTRNMYFKLSTRNIIFQALN